MLTTKKITTGLFEVYWKGEKTEWEIFNGSAGCSGYGQNMYGIRNGATGKHRFIGSIQACKKILTLTLSKKEAGNV